MATHTFPGATLPGRASIGAAARARTTAAPERRPAHDNVRARHRAATRVGLLGLVHFVNDAYSCVLTALLPAVLPALGLTIGAGGVLTATYQLVSAVLQPVVGHLSDRRGMGWPIWVGLGLTALGSSVVGLAPTFPVLIACAAVASVGTSLFHPVAAATVGRLAPDEGRGRWMGLYETVGWAGTVVGPLVIGLTVGWAGPAGTWPIVLPALVLVLALTRLAPSPTATVAPSTPVAETAPARAGRPTRLLAFLGVFTLVGSLRAWTYSAAALFLPLLGSEVGLGASGAAHLLTVFLAAGALGSLACGSASDRLGARRVVAGALALAVPLGLGMILVEPRGLGLFAFAATTGFLLTGAYTGLTVAGQRRLPDNTGMVTGLNVGLTTGLGGLAVIPLAALADDVGLRTALAGALILGPLLALVIWLPAGRTPHRPAPSG